MVVAWSARWSPLGTQLALPGSLTGRGWGPRECPGGIQRTGDTWPPEHTGLLCRPLRPSRPMVLWEATLRLLLPSGEDSLFLYERTRAPARQPAPGHLTSNYSRGFISAGGKGQVLSAPVSGHRPPLAALLSPVARGPRAQDSTGWHGGSLGTGHTQGAPSEAGSGGHCLRSLRRAGWEGAGRCQSWKIKAKGASWKLGNSQFCSVLATTEVMTWSRCLRGCLARDASEGKESRHEKVLGLRKKFQRELHGEL